MKLVANVQVTTRLQSAGSGRAQRASLTIGKQPGTENLFLLCQTTQNKIGTKYKILGNIERLFTTYLKEGKATIRFVVPSHDLSINSMDIIQLKCFVQTLKHALENKVPQKSLRLSSLYPTGPAVPKLKTSLTITTKHEYPVLIGFPRTLEKLSINQIEMKLIDSKILRLQSLQVLNLSHNLLSTIPEALGQLPALTTLNLSNNQLGNAADQESNWLWCDSKLVAIKLRMLDLSNNGLLEVTTNIGNLKALVHLKIDGNLLESLPPMIGSLTKLRYLSAANNRLAMLPACMKHLNLEFIDMAGNRFRELRKPILSQQGLGIPWLSELAARVIVNKRLKYPLNTLPKRLLNYINKANYCSCGSACFETSFETESWLDLKSISGTVVTDYGNLVKISVFYCSQKCKTKYTKYD